MEHTEFSFVYEDTPYYGSIGTLYKETGALDITLVSPAASLEQQILRQRMNFIGINIVSSILLAAFSYYFTGKLLKPIAKSHEDQVHFIGAASHELRTPLAVILSCTEACKKADFAEKDKFLHTIHSEGIRMSRLIGDMLFLSKADSRAFSIDKTECAPDTLLLTSYESFEMFAKEKGIALTVSLPDESAISCTWDPERITQVLTILLQNAVSYTPEGGHVTLSMGIQQNHIIYTVSDTGIGIANEYKKEIFKRFYRVDNSRNEKEHFGLGLSIALEIVSAHHGTIQVCDTPGGGSTFIVMLPIA